MKGLFDNLTLRKDRSRDGDDGMLRGNSNLGESLLGAADSIDGAGGSNAGYTPPVLDQDAPEVSGKLKLMIKVPPGRRGGQVVSAKLPGRRSACRLVIPNGLGPGDRFQISIPHVRRNSSRAIINTSSPNNITNSQGLPSTNQDVNYTPRLDDETESFIAALPEEMREQVRQERAAQAAMLGEMESSQSHTNSMRPKLLEFTVPDDATPGSTVQTQGPNGESISVYIPEGIEAGEVICIPVPETTS